MPIAAIGATAAKDCNVREAAELGVPLKGCLRE